MSKIKDQDNDNNINYLDLMSVPTKNDLSTIKLIKVIVDTNPNPNEVITWMVQRNIGKRKSEIKKGGIIYDRSQQLSNQQV